MLYGFGRGKVARPARRAVARAAFDTLEGRQLLSTTHTLDFETDAAGNPLVAADFVDIKEQYAAWGVHISTDVSNVPGANPADHPAKVFDTSAPTGDDVDLGTPNESVKISQDPEIYGPGKGHYGGEFEPGANTKQLFNVLIVEQDNVKENTEGPDGPNDWDMGGALVLTFDTPVTIHDLDVLDIDTNEGTVVLPNVPTPPDESISFIALFDSGGNLLKRVDLGGYGDNSYQKAILEQSGVSKMVVEFRGIDPSNGRINASGAIDNIRFTIPDEPPPPTGGGQGLTPGYWKQSQHFFAWTGFTTGQSFEAVFGVDVPGVNGSYSLLDALNDGGGGYHALNRHAVAALLNASNPSVNYKYTTAEVIQMVQDAYASGDFEATKNLLAAQNELGGSIPKP